MAKRSAPEVNAGSMADIAFLLLIFFLVTTTIETDSGINRKLPPIEDVEDPPIIKQKNIFTVVVNKYNQLLVEEELTSIEDLRSLAVEFLDNGGGEGEDACNFCQGPGDPKSSDNPVKAIISLKNDRETSYKVYISVQNELVAAYNFLRDRESKRLYGWNFSEVKKDIDAGTYLGDITDARAKLKEVQLLFPLKLSEAEPKKKLKLKLEMSKFKKKKGGELPVISTASLPDIVFMLLFFFMVATVMRDSTLMVKNKLPAADQIQKLDKKDRVMYIYAGEPSSRYTDKYGSQPRIQLNDKFATVSEVAAFVLAERASKRQELQNVLTTSLKVDGDTKMGLITDIKQELRKVNALKINYTTRIGDYTQNRD